MDQLNEQQVLQALRQVADPDSGNDIVSLGMVRNLVVGGGLVSFGVVLRNPAAKDAIEQGARAEVSKLPGVREVQVRFEQPAAPGPGVRGQPQRTPIPGVKSLIAVASGKGGVGKTTVAVNLAVALGRMGHAVGLMDADVYGPNVPRMMGTEDTPRAQGERIIPLENYGVRMMSMGFLNPGDRPLIWRGPMLHSVIQQFIRNVEWGELDYLVVDLPPGTGDVQLTLLQTVPITGAVVVTTPSDVSLEDARKAIEMFRQVKAEILGVVENMSYFICPHCSKQVDVFSHGGGERTAKQYGVPFLGHLPLDPEVRIGGDTGVPVAVRGPDSPQAQPFYSIARLVEARVQEAGGASEPVIRIRD